MEDVEDLVPRPGCDPRAAMKPLGEPRPERLDRRHRDVLLAHLAELGQQVDIDDRAVVLNGRGLPSPVLIDVAQVLRGGVRECRTSPHHPGQFATAGVLQETPEPVLREPLREVAGWRPAATRPRGAESLLDLPPVWEPVLRVPLRTPDAIHPKHMPRWRMESAGHTAILRPSRDISGTIFRVVTRGWWPKGG
jgi:hypothetical protein